VRVAQPVLGTERRSEQVLDHDLRHDPARFLGRERLDRQTEPTLHLRLGTEGLPAHGIGEQEEVPTWKNTGSVPSSSAKRS
jgi:hypothetical protein